MHKSVLTIGILLASAGVAPTLFAQTPRYSGGDAIECSSHGYERERCNAPWRDARLVRQLSDTRCVRDENWGVDRHGLWVDHGCSGQFVEAGRNGQRDRLRGERGVRNRQGGWQPGPGWNRRFSVTCESQDSQYHFCQVDLGGAGRASMQRQLSNSTCVEGESWGSNRAGIWVNRGCRAVFTIDRRWH